MLEHDACVDAIAVAGETANAKGMSEFDGGN